MYDEDIDDLIVMYDKYIKRCAIRSLEMERSMEKVLKSLGVIVRDVYIPKKNNFVTISPPKDTLTIQDCKGLITDLTKSKHIIDHVACVETCKDSKRPHIHLLFKHDYAKHKSKNCENHTVDKIRKDIKKKLSKYITTNVSLDIQGPFPDDADDIKKITNYIIKPERLKYKDDGSEYKGNDIKWINYSGDFYEPKLKDYYDNIKTLEDNFLLLVYKQNGEEE